MSSIKWRGKIAPQVLRDCCQKGTSIFKIVTFFGEKNFFQSSLSFRNFRERKYLRKYMMIKTSSKETNAGCQSGGLAFSKSGHSDFSTRYFFTKPHRFKSIDNFSSKRANAFVRRCRIICQPKIPRHSRGSLLAAPYFVEVHDKSSWPAMPRFIEHGREQEKNSSTARRPFASLAYFIHLFFRYDR